MSETLAATLALLCLLLLPLILAHLPRGAEHRTLGKRPGRGRSRGARRGSRGPAGGQDVAASLLPEQGLPLVSGKGAVEEEEVLLLLLPLCFYCWSCSCFYIYSCFYSYSHSYTR